MSAPLTIVAIIQAVEGHAAEVEKALLSAVAPTLAEAGCLQYDLHRDHEQPGRFLYYENWATRAQWEAHMASAHLAAMKAATEGLVTETIIFQMVRLEEIRA